MVINIILAVVLLALIVHYMYTAKCIQTKEIKEIKDSNYSEISKEHFDTENKIIEKNKLQNNEVRSINDVLPNTSSTSEDYIASHEHLPKNCEQSECEKIDAYNNRFFNFRTRINNNSHQNDSVDNINITNKAQDYYVGAKISDIYDDLVNSNDYKTSHTTCLRKQYAQQK